MLCECVKLFIESDDDQYSIKVLYLFYDNFDAVKPNIKYIEPYDDENIIIQSDEPKLIQEKPKNDLTQKTVKELIQLCKDRNIGGYSRKKKAEIIALLNDK